jgi:hypothetical protein
MDIKSISVLLHLSLPNNLFPPDFPILTLVIHLHIKRATRLAHHILLDLLIQMLLSKNKI